MSVFEQRGAVPEPMPLNHNRGMYGAQRQFNFRIVRPTMLKPNWVLGWSGFRLPLGR